MHAIAPGTIRRPMHSDDIDKNACLHLVNRIDEVKAVAKMIYTVAKSNFINGAIINIDGGMAAAPNLN